MSVADRFTGFLIEQDQQKGKNPKPQRSEMRYEDAPLLALKMDAGIHHKVQLSPRNKKKLEERCLELTKGEPVSKENVKTGTGETRFCL